MATRAKLTQAELNARRIERKRADLERRELTAVGGPNSLFRDEAAPVTTEQAAWHVRRNHAVGREAALGGAGSALDVQLDLLRLSAVERFAAGVIGEPAFTGLRDYCRGTYPSVGYWLGFWRRLLTTCERVVIKYERVESPPPYRPGHVTLVPVSEWPAAGWVPVMTGGEFDARFPVWSAKPVAGEEAESSDAVFDDVMGKIQQGCRR